MAKDMVEQWDAHMENYRRAVERLKEVSTAAAQAHDSHEMAEEFTRWISVLNEYCIYLLAPFSVELVHDPRCRELLEQEFEQEQAEKYFTVLSTPDETHAYQRMRMKVLDAVIKGTANSDFYIKMAEEFGWYNEYSYVESFVLPEYYAAEAAKMTPEAAQHELEEIVRGFEENKRAYTDLMALIKNPELKTLAEIVHTYTLLRTSRMDEFKQAQARMRIFFDRVAAGLSADSKKTWGRYEVVSLTHEEILSYLHDGKIPDVEIATLRARQQYIYYTIDGKPEFIYEEKEITEAISAITGRDLIQKNIQGTIAFKGVAQGKVSIVNSKADLSKVNPGDVLVARVTMPDYLPAMIHAVAFVTDEGGITSHAAIVARELKKPCVVGTKTATNMLKDGDMVEVDANMGIITIMTH